VSVVIIIFLIILNGIFAMSEIALVTARKVRLQKMANEGDVSAARAMALGENPTQFLSTIQIGITAISLLNGIVGEVVLAEPLASGLQQAGLGKSTSFVTATLIVVIGITYVTIVIGELVPKRLAQFNAEEIARVMALPLSLLARVSRPFVLLLAKSTDLILLLLGKSARGEAELTEEDIEAVLDEGSQIGVIDQYEHEMVRNALRLDERKAASLMTPRSETVYLDLEHPLAQNLEILLSSEHAYFPVCKGGFDNVQGIISAKQLLKQQLHERQFYERQFYEQQSHEQQFYEQQSHEQQSHVQPSHDQQSSSKQHRVDAQQVNIQPNTQKPSTQAMNLVDSLLPAVYVPENWRGTQVLELFRDSGDVMVFVVDEYGDLQGIVTALDVLEALVGEFKTSNPEDLWSVRNDDGSWLLDGLIPIMVLKDMLVLKSVPEEEKGGYHTLGGMMLWLLGGLPEIHDSCQWQGWIFEVTALDGNRVDKVIARQVTTP
jgi:putative hemolysin